MIMTDIRETMRAKWFLLYCIMFGGAIILLFAFGITESQVLGFTGLTRLLITYIQLCIAVLPIFILISTVRSVVGDRESNILEYFLSMPISLGAYFWGKLLSKFVMVFLPILLALTGAVIWGTIQGLSIPWGLVSYYSMMLASVSWCFLGIGMLISSSVRQQEFALGLSFFIWLLLLLFIDIIMIGILMQRQFPESLVIGLALVNPVQVFRTGAILLFDPELSAIGPASYVILDFFGKTGYLIFAVVYPMVLGWFCSWVGFQVFKRGDLI
ncbi:MAG: ABC transporter permease [SAR324 cluster bacterium]|uniref:ABC transporter permease n=1 Tax=SAR324 cluster bacterium TaxID=2024889 RepID=A0A2A4SV40_9DELT|nr:MAG: ABC transporter permease [SAR324 cluster bacterium]